MSRHTFERVWIIVGSSGLVVIECHWPVALVVLDADAVRAVDRQLQVVGAEAVAVRVGVREQAALQHLVGAGLDSGHQMRWREGDLLDLGEIIVRVSVQREFSDRN